MEQSIMSKKFTLLAAGVAALLFSACGDNVVESYSPENPAISDQTSPTAVAATAKLTVVVQNGSDKSLVQGAKVTLLSATGQEKTTSAAGAVFFDSVAVGSHGVRVVLNGFASAVAVGEVKGTSSENIYQAENGSITVQLYPLTAKLEGYLRYDDVTNKTQPAVGAEVRLVLTPSSPPSPLEVSQYTATVAAGGKYQFDKLPAVGGDFTYSIYALEWTDTTTNITYPTQRILTASANNTQLLEKSTVFIDHVKYSKNTSLFEVLSFTDKVEAGSPVVIEFSDSIDIARFSSSQVSTSPVLDFTAEVLPTDKTKLRLTPRGGKWVIDPVLYPTNTGTFTVTVNGLKSIKGNSVNVTSNNTVTLLLERDAFSLLSYTNRINNANDSLVFTFSDDIDAKKLNSSLISVNSTYLAPLDYRVNGKTLVIKPKSGNWLLNVNNVVTQFTITVNPLTSVKGKTSSDINARQINLIYEDPDFRLLDYTNRINNEEDSLVFTFSDDIDATKHNSSLISVGGNNSSYIGPLDYRVDGKKLIVKPKIGNWLLDINNIISNFTITVSPLTSVKGKTSTAINGLQIYLIYENPDFRLLNWTNRINNEEDSLVFTFSDDIDETKHNSSLISVSNSSYIAPLDYRVDGKTLIVKPKFGADWLLNINNVITQFNITVSPLTSVKGKTSTGITNLQINLIYENPDFRLLETTDRINAEGNIVFTFSDAIDDTKFNTGLVSVSPALNFDASFSDDKTQLILAPRDGKWVIDPVLNTNTGSFTVNVGILTSVKGKTYDPESKTITLLTENSQFSLLNFTNAIGIGEDVVFTFSDAIDVTRVASNTVTITANSANLNFDVSFSEDKKQIILTPKGGKWSTTSLNMSTNNFTLYSVKGASTSSGTRTISLAHSFKLLSDYASPTYLTSNTDTIKLKFSDEIDATKFYRGGDAANSTIWAGLQADITVSNDSVYIAPLVKWTSDVTVQFSSAVATALTSKNGEQVLGIGSIIFRLPIADLNDKPVTGLVYADTISHDNYNVDQNGATKPSIYINGNTVNQYFTLKFDEVPGATGCIVWAKATTGANKGTFVQLNSSSATGYLECKVDSALARVRISDSYNFTTANFGPLNLLFRNGNKIEFVVQAFNANSRTKLNGSSTAEVYDKARPFVANTGNYSRFEPIPGTESLAMFSTYGSTHTNSTLGGNYYGYDANEIETGSNFYYFYFNSKNASNGIASSSKYAAYNGLNYYLNLTRNADDTVAVHTQWFNEDLDVDAISVSFDPPLPEDVAERLSAEISWLSPNSSNTYGGFNIVLKVKAGDPIDTQVESNLIVSGIQDKAGNPARLIYKNATNGDVPDSVLRFKITANTP
jgi:hypothetical protein